MTSEYKNWYPGQRNAFTKRGDSVEKLLNVCVKDFFHSSLLINIFKECYCVYIFTSWTTYEPELLNAILHGKHCEVRILTTFNNPLPLEEYYSLTKHQTNISLRNCKFHPAGRIKFYL